MDSLLSLDPLLNNTVGIAEQPVDKNISTYAFPNPFENKVTIGYYLDAPSKVNVDVYSIYGNCVMTLQSEMVDAGAHEIIWDGKNNTGQKLAAGSYIYIVRTAGKQNYGKLTLLSGK
jgi:flagellar hook assembly protein FlgD